MEIFGIGIWEVLLIIIIALLVLGPQDTVKAGYRIGRAVRRFFSSEEWRTLLQASKDIRTIPDKLMEETGLDHPEEFLPSEAEFREQAGLDDLQKDVAAWNADLDSMKKGTNLGQDGTETILPPQAARQAANPNPVSANPGAAGTPTRSDGAAPREAGLEDVERELSHWKADLSAWGSSKVIVPIPQPPAAEPASDPAGDGQASATKEKTDPPQDQASSQPPEEESGQADSQDKGAG